MFMMAGVVVEAEDERHFEVKDMVGRLCYYCTPSLRSLENKTEPKT